jgi:hypothetical protein
VRAAEGGLTLLSVKSSPSLSKPPCPRPSPQGTPEALPYPSLRRLSSTSQRHAAPRSAARGHGVAAGGGRAKMPCGIPIRLFFVLRQAWLLATHGRLALGRKSTRRVFARAPLPSTPIPPFEGLRGAPRLQAPPQFPQFLSVYLYDALCHRGRQQGAEPIKRARGSIPSGAGLNPNRP